MNLDLQMFALLSGILLSLVSVAVAVWSYRKASATASDLERRLAEMAGDEPVEDVETSLSFDDSDPVEAEQNG